MYNSPEYEKTYFKEVLNNFIEEKPMYQILAIVPPPIILLTLVIFAFLALLIIPKLRRSKMVDKLNDGLFGDATKSTVDEAIDGIKTGKDALVDKSKENVQKIADTLKEQTRIQDGLKK